MNLQFTSEQNELQASVARLLGDIHSFAQRRALVRDDAPFHEGIWRHFAQLGLTALPIAQDDGGLGGSAVDLLVVLREFGRALVVEPYVASSVLGAAAVALAGSTQQRQQQLPAVAAGERRLAWAHDEADAHHAPLWVACTATQGADGWRITGHKSCVQNAEAAHALIVSARISGAPGDPQGLGLFVVDCAAAGLSRQPLRLVDDSRAADCDFASTPAQWLGGEGARCAQAVDAIAQVQARGMAAACAEMLGLMETAYALTRDYVNTRQQFGRPIGANQALRHRFADMRVALELATSMAMLAAIAIDDPESTRGAALELARAKLVVGQRARALCEAAIQLHGGVGMTEEFAVGHCLRRLIVLDQMFGDTHAQASRLADHIQTTSCDCAPLR